MFLKRLLALTAITVGATCAVIPRDLCAEIYVIKGSDGSITFTTRKPPEGVKASIFRPEKITNYSRASLGARLRSRRLFVREYHEVIAAVASEKRLDPSLIKAIIHAESSFNPAAVSPKGAIGLMQLMPGTAREVGVVNPFNPAQNIRGGATYLAWLLDKYRGDLVRAVAAYNAGPDAVDAHRGIPPFSETRLYVRKVMALHHAYRSAHT